MSFNTFGHLFRVTTFGESHGPAIGCVVDGCPPRIALDRGRHPALARQAPARPVALHHAAAGARHGPHPLRRVHGRGDRRAGDDRHADRARDRQRRPALQGLCRHQGQISSRPRRLHLRRQIRLARLSRRRPAVGARDGDARRRRRDRAQGRAGPAKCAARSCRWARMRSIARAGTGPRSSAIRSSARTPKGPRSSTTISTACASAALRSARSSRS